MPIPQVNDRIKEAPVVVLRAVFAGIGQILLTADKVRNRAVEQVWTQDRAPERASAGLPADRRTPEPPRNGTPRTGAAVVGHSAVHEAPKARSAVTTKTTPAARRTPATKTGPGAKTTPGTKTGPGAKTTPATNTEPAAKTTLATRTSPAAKSSPATKAKPATNTPRSAKATPADKAMSATKPAVKATPVAKTTPAAKATPNAKPPRATQAPRATKAAKTAPAPGTAEAEPATQELPLPGYDDLSIASLRARLRVLDAPAIQAMLAYEKAHAGREPVITMLERRLAKISAG